MTDDAERVGTELLDLVLVEADLLRQFLRATFLAGYPLVHRGGQILVEEGLGEEAVDQFRRAMKNAALARLARDMGGGPETTRRILKSWSSEKRNRSLMALLMGRAGGVVTRRAAAAATGVLALSAALQTVGVDRTPHPPSRRNRPPGPDWQSRPVAVVPLGEQADLRWARLVLRFAATGLKQYRQLQVRGKLKDRRVVVRVPSGSRPIVHTLPLAEAILANRRALRMVRQGLDPLIEEGGDGGDAFFDLVLNQARQSTRLGLGT